MGNEKGLPVSVVLLGSEMLVQWEMLFNAHRICSHAGDNEVERPNGGGLRGQSIYQHLHSGHQWKPLLGHY